MIDDIQAALQFRMVQDIWNDSVEISGIPDRQRSKGKAPFGLGSLRNSTSLGLGFCIEYLFDCCAAPANGISRFNRR